MFILDLHHRSKSLTKIKPKLLLLQLMPKLTTRKKKVPADLMLLLQTHQTRQKTRNINRIELS